MSLQAYNPQLSIIEQYSTATVVGLGASGYSAVRYLAARGLSVTALDSRTAPPMLAKLQQAYPEVALHLGDFDQTVLANSALLIVSPGVSLFEPTLRMARQQGAHIVGDIELFLQENQQPVIAITGSNGKSTVTMLVGEMCKAASMNPLVAGNIGLPALDALTDQVGYDLAVLELSSFQLDTTYQVSAKAAAILNISADHMDRYASMGDYVLSKARVLRGAELAVLPRHDEQIQQVTNIANVLSFELDEPANDKQFGLKKIADKRWLMKGEQRLIKMQEVGLTGLHNVKNVLAALALVDFLKLPQEPLMAVVKSFGGLPHRMQTVLSNQRLTWVNDSKATNVGATSSALQSLEKNIIWIAGGQGKEADFTELRDALSSKIKLLIVLGEDAHLIAQALGDALPIQHAQNMQQAVAMASEYAKSLQDTHTIVLLSPACASFDMYQSYIERGNDFMLHVRNIKQAVV